MLCLAFILLAGGALKAQAPSAVLDFQTILNSITAKYGRVLDVTNTELTGTITYAGKTAGTPFTLTFRQREVRCEFQDVTGTVVSIRQDGRVQHTRGGKIGFPNQSALFSSHVNLSPVFGLLSFNNDDRFTSSVVTAKDGSVGLSFREGTPRGQVPPPFPQPKLIVTFWLTSTYLIESASYTYDDKRDVLVTYRYTHDLSVPGAFLQANNVELLTGTTSVWRADISKTRNNVTLTTDFFKILENRERKFSPLP